MVEKGRVAIVEYSLFAKDTGELIDTTSEAEAKLYRKYVSEAVYEPEVVVVGEGRFFPGFEESLEKCEVGVEREFEIPPEKGYGFRDPAKVKTFPRRIFEKQNLRPEVGREVRINGDVGRILAVEGGRVIVDFNHQLAGKVLKLKMRVIKVLEDPVEIVKYLVKRRLRGAKVDNIGVDIEKERGRVVVELPREFRVGREIQYAKTLIAYDILKNVKEVKEVVFLDRFTIDELRG
ncbi:MAG: FKBP-type peptidyl-prolyl cis-trans isomerase [Sulfolobales archaeon]|nr:peptidylprolyl isomerase [Sulfolobales archaeon]MCX8208944.1 peptidylprolyl isomerase [Sulfolobales archaeon]MDW8010402.1 FKBP-type peptidyl-prolyl cis-trans isomerase [Sulfolobales archaeon]